MEIKDGGPAFPLDVHPSNVDLVVSGMSIRDWFAGQAIAGIYAHTTSEERGYLDPEKAVVFAYEVADAMLKQRPVSEGTKE